jgi:hypothetical protein
VLPSLLLSRPSKQNLSNGHLASTVPHHVKERNQNNKRKEKTRFNALFQPLKIVF